MPFDDCHIDDRHDRLVDPKEMEPVAPERFESAEGRGFKLATFNNETIAFGNRTYVWRDIPAAFRGWRYTQSNGGQLAPITVTAKQPTMLLVATTKTVAPGFAGWSDH